MEQTMLWVTIFGVIIIPLLGWIINTVITRKIDDLQNKTEDLDKLIKDLEDRLSTRSDERFRLIFKRIDDMKDAADKTYVRDGEYKIHREYQEKDVDQKFKSMMTTMTTQFQNVEDKIDELKDSLKIKGNH